MSQNQKINNETLFAWAVLWLELNSGIPVSMALDDAKNYAPPEDKKLFQDLKASVLEGESPVFYKNVSSQKSDEYQHLSKFLKQGEESGRLAEGLLWGIFQILLFRKQKKAPWSESEQQLKVTLDTCDLSTSLFKELQLWLASQSKPIQEGLMATVISRSVILFISEVNQEAYDLLKEQVAVEAALLIQLFHYLFEMREAA